MADIPKKSRTGSFSDFLNNNNLAIRDQALFRKALIHRSYLNENSDEEDDNERLEFLGDAVLDLVVGKWLFDRFPENKEGELTRLRSMLVCTEQVADFARKIHLGPVLKLGNGEEQAGGREKDAILCGAFEAIIGVLYLQKSIEAVNGFLHPLLNDAIRKIVNEPSRDPKSRLQEWSQAQGTGIPGYLLLTTTGPEHEKTFEVAVQIDGVIIGRGKGKNKQEAERSAALEALKVIEG